MPTIRARQPLPPLADYTMVELLCFVSIWSPMRGRGRWRTWTEYLSDYCRFRSELYQKFRTGQRKAFGPLFGDRVLAYRDRHGLAALEAADAMTIRSVLAGTDRASLTGTVTSGCRPRRPPLP